MQHVKHSLGTLHAGLECNARFYHIVCARSRGYGSSGPFNWIAAVFSSVPVKDGRRINLSTKLLPTLPHSARWALRSHVSTRRVSIFLITLRNTQVMSQLAEPLCSCPTDVPRHGPGRSWAEGPHSRMGNLSGCVRDTLRNPINPRVQKNNVHFFLFPACSEGAESFFISF